MKVGESERASAIESCGGTEHRVDSVGGSVGYACCATSRSRAREETQLAPLMWVSLVSGLWSLVSGLSFPVPGQGPCACANLRLRLRKRKRNVPAQSSADFVYKKHQFFFIFSVLVRYREKSLSHWE